MGPSALRFRSALGWVFIAGLAAQLVGGLTSAWAHTALGADAGGMFVPAMVASAATLLLVVFLAPVLSGVPVRAALGLHAAPLPVFLATAVGTVMLGPTADALMTLMGEWFPTFTLGTVPALNEAVSTMPFALAWPAFALLPGISEELLFRGLLQRAAPPGTRAIVVSGVVFALFHVDPHHVVGVLPLGLFLAWAAERAGVFVTAGAHVANNTAAVLVAQSGALHVGYGTSTEMPWTWIPASLVVVAVSAWVVARNTSPPSRVRA